MMVSESILMNMFWYSAALAVILAFSFWSHIPALRFYALHILLWTLSKSSSVCEAVILAVIDAVTSLTAALWCLVTAGREPLLDTFPAQASSMPKANKQLGGKVWRLESSNFSRSRERFTQHACVGMHWQNHADLKQHLN